MNPETEQRGLARTDDRTPAVITTPDEYRQAMQRWEGRFNVLTPFTNISGLAAQHGIIVSTVRINADDSKGGPGEVYGGLPFLNRGEVALAKIGLRKIAECGAISTETVRTDPRTIPHYWEVKAIARYRGIDGAIVTREATQEWDLRDGSARLKGWTQNQIEEGRKHGLRNCEARAVNAAIRECGCGIKQKYTKDELAKPFIVLRVAFQPDMSDPATRRLVTEQALRGTSTLYGGGPALPAGGAPEIVDGEVTTAEPQSVGRGATSAAQSTGTPNPPHPDMPPVEGAVRIVEVKDHKGTRKDGSAWVRFVIIDHLGAQHSTFDSTIADAARRSIDSKQWMELTEEMDGDFKTLVELAPAGQNPPLPGMDRL